MPSTLITAGDVTTSLVYTGGNDNTLTIQTGPSGGKLNALTIDGVGKATLLKTPIFTDAPVFSAYQSAAQSLPTTTFTKLQFQTKEFDLGTYFDAVTNFRYLPLVAGYYQVTGGFQLATTVTTAIVSIYKNGAAFKNTGSDATSGRAYGSALVFLNGSTDYVELFASQAAAAQNTGTGASATYFQAVLVRAA